MTLEYRQSLTELDKVLSYMDEDNIKKVPNKILDFIKRNMDKNYSPNIDRNIPVYKQPLKKDTRVLLSLLYRHFWCSSEKKERLLAEDKEELDKYFSEIQRRSTFNASTTDSNSINEAVTEECKEIVTVEKMNFFKRILDRIIKFFKRK
jgi:hypothetical protein